ncbi:hypothetical protein HYG81_21595 (plasmid) [Natrinema zhouii]|uniref:hypothetical protein n=1 Tax=Natrinema zhouii TaxID=1710539 RepID=UPI001CFF6715|nr:hypothetical protein [Natrinema zhouii]UHQ98167.1 hypothetical protein HYG81_21595 [Natrinema zhouii]
MGDFKFCARCRINRTYSNTRTRFLYDNMGFLGSFDRDDIPKVPDPPSRDEKKNSGNSSPEDVFDDGNTGYESWQVPREVPDECPHNNGPEYHWEDYSWADQGKARCRNCKTKVEKDRLPNSVIIHDGW